MGVLWGFRGFWGRSKDTSVLKDSVGFQERSRKFYEISWDFPGRFMKFQEVSESVQRVVPESFSRFQGCSSKFQSVSRAFLQEPHVDKSFYVVSWASQRVSGFFTGVVW